MSMILNTRHCLPSHEQIPEDIRYRRSYRNQWRRSAHTKQPAPHCEPRCMAGTLHPSQPDQRRQSACARNSACAQLRGHRTSSGSLNPAKKPDLPRCAVPAPTPASSVPQKPITAMAHRLARLVYRMLKYGQQYVDKGAAHYERRHRQQQIEFIGKKAAQLGLQVTAAPSLNPPAKKFLESR